jgi:hypothetical protein
MNEIDYISVFIVLIEKGKRPNQLIPKNVWENVLKDVSAQFFNGMPITDAKKARQLRDNLSGYLKKLGTGTSNGKNDCKPELQNIEVLKQLKESDTYRSKVMHQVRLDLITSPAPKRPRVESDADSEPNVEKTKKESRSRSTLTIEMIASNSSSQTSFQEVF